MTEESLWEKYKKNNKNNSKPWDLINKKRVPQYIQEERMEICLSCPELILKTKTCKKCGCFMTAKTKLPNSFCPLLKWNQFTEEEL